MKRVLATFLALVIMSSLMAAPTLKKAQTQQLTPWDFAPALIPSSAEDVVTGDVYIDSITIINPTASAVTLEILDKQNTPREILDVTIAANTTYVIKMWTYYSPGGIRWSAGTNNVLVGHIRMLR